MTNVTTGLIAKENPEMKRLLASAALAAVLFSTSAALAASDETTAKVKAYDAAKHELNLGGKNNKDVVYYVPADLKDPGLKPGVRVTVSWELQDGKHQVSAIAIAPPKEKKPKAKPKK